MSSRGGAWSRRLMSASAPVLLGLWAVLAAASAGRLLAGLAVTLPVVAVLAVAPRWPALGLLTAFGALLLPDSASVTLPEDPFLAMLVYACYVYGRHASMTLQPWAAAGVLLLLSLNLTEPGRDLSTADAVFPVLLTAGPWLLGLSVQVARRREQEALRYAAHVDSRHEDDVRRATVEERMRIARELHDVVAHDISAVSLQAQVARSRLDAGDQLGAEDLRTIELTAQQAMTDLRRLLGVLRPPEGSVPVAPSEGLEQLDSFVEGLRRLGQQIDVRTEGPARDLPPLLSLTAFRILQEALTNARRHGLQGRTLVEVVWHEDRLHLRVENPADQGDGHLAGHGLVGIGERVHMFAGRFTAGVDDDRGVWVVEVELPTPRQAKQVAS